MLGFVLALILILAILVRNLLQINEEDAGGSFYLSHKAHRDHKTKEKK